MKKRSSLFRIMPVALLLIASIFSNAFAADIEVSDARTTAVALTANDNLLITESGSINIANHAVTTAVTEDNIIITNNGLINTTGGNGADGHDGVHANGDSALITNNGTINTDGTFSDGIHIDGDSATVINNNTIESTTAYGIYTIGSGTKITNNSTITGYIASIGTHEAQTTIINNGLLTYDPDNINPGGDGIYSHEADTVIINNGTIIAEDSGVEIITGASNLQVTNRGSITATYGVSSTEDGTIITNSGTIIGSSNAIYLGNADSLVTNSGKLTSTDVGSYAIFAENTNDDTIILQKGSEVIGAIDLGAGTSDSLTVTGNGISSTLVTENIENLALSPDVAGVVVGDTVHVIDPTGVAMLATTVNKLSNNIHNITNLRGNKASNSSAEPKIWSQVFSSSFSRGEESQNLAYESDNVGFVGGYELSSDSGSTKGLIFGISSGDMSTDRASIDTDVKSLFTGFYNNFNLSEETIINTSIVAGYERYETKRQVIENLNGLQTARSSFSNFFFSPSVALERKIKLSERFELNPTARINYTSSLFGSRQEKGVSSGVATKSHSAHILNSRAGLKAVMNFSGGEITLEGGLDSRIIKENDINASVDSTSFRYSTNNGSTNGKYLRVGANIADFKGFTLNANFEKRSADGNEDESFTQIGALYKF